MPGDERTATVLHASCMLRRPEFQTEYLLVSADLALYAKDRGSVGSIESFMQLMIAAADRSALSASFESAKRFLDGYESASYTLSVYPADHQVSLRMPADWTPCWRNLVPIISDT
jgi:hypothetical protein